jgi:hypothetical protein
MKLLGQPWPFWRRRLGHVSLLLGLALAAGILLDAYPREQILVFRLDPGRPVHELRASWVELSGDVLGGAVLHYPEGRTQPVRHPIRLRDGQYDVQIHLTYGNLESSHDGARTEKKVTRRVTLRGGETPISLIPTTPRKP